MSYFIPYIDDKGIHMPTYVDRLDYLSSSYKSIFGLDAELSDAVPDYQLISVFSKALDDVSALLLQAYNSCNPFMATGQALNLLLPQYGLTRTAGESDASLRNKIHNLLYGDKVSIPDALLKAVRSAFKVQMAKVFLNNRPGLSIDENMPMGSMAVVVYKGNAAAIAQAIYDNKSPGTVDYGTSTGTAVDAQGNNHTMNFVRAADKLCYVYLSIKKFPGASESAIEDAIRPAILNHINSLYINEDLIVPQLYGVSYAAASEIAGTFAIMDIQVAAAGAQSSTRDVVECEWNKKLSATAANGVNFAYTTSMPIVG